MSGAKDPSIKRKPPARWLSALLWTLAVILTLAAGLFQRVTGPSYALKGSAAIGAASYRYSLPRSHDTGEAAPVWMAIPDRQVKGLLRWRRLEADDAWTEKAMTRSADTLIASLPSQPPAGKLEYFVELTTESERVMIPREQAAVLRFKGAVPPWALLPHIALMFIAMLVAVRAGLDAIWLTGRLRGLTWWATGTLLLGGFVFGPMVEGYAFGTPWTGVPLGWDLTDNKTLVAMLFWLAAAFIAGWRKQGITPAARWAVVIATIVLIGAFTIPHSSYGSALDYAKYERGASLREAIVER